MTQLNVNLDYEELASAIFGSDMNASMKTIAMTVINAYMEMERDKYVNAGYKQKNSGRNAQRNGYYERDFLMPIGNLTLKVPRTRDGEFTTEVFNQYSRSDQSLILAMTEAYINGVSTRNVNKIVESLTGKSVSKSTVSSVIKNLDPEIKEWAGRPIVSHQYKYVFVDAMHIKVRENNKIVSKGVYIAMGINENRKRDIIGFKISNQESELAWSEFFEDLRMRGLTTPELIISDASQFYRFPAQHHKNLRTTNSVENINMQLRKREKIVKTFSNLDSAFRLIGAVLMDIQERFDKSNRPFIA